MRQIFKFFLALTASLQMQAQVITTIAGTDFLFQGDGRPVSEAKLGTIRGVATDSRGNVYIADPESAVVVKVSPAGLLNVVAGNGIPGFSGDGGLAIHASLDHAIKIHVDRNDNLFIFDAFNARLRKVTADGIIRTVAGNGLAGYTGDDVSAVDTRLADMEGFTTDPSGNIYVSGGGRLRKITTDGIVRLLAGLGTYASSGDGGPASKAAVDAFHAIVVDGSGNLLLADRAGFRIRKITPDGNISSIAGTGVSGFTPDGNRAAGSAISTPRGLALDAGGNIYFSDSDNNRIRKIGVDGFLSTVAGTGVAGFAGDGGAAKSAQLSAPESLAFDRDGNLFVEDRTFARTRRIAADGTISTVALGGNFRPVIEGVPALAAFLNRPDVMTFDGDGNLYFSDLNHSLIRKLTPAGVLTTIAGNGVSAFGPDNVRATQSSLNHPEDVIFDSAGNLFITDKDNNRVRKISPSGIITTVAGNGTHGVAGDNGPAVSASVDPTGLAFDAAGNLYITDSINHVIRKVGKDGIIVRVAGNGSAAYAGENVKALGSSISFPAAALFDSKGNMFVAEFGTERVRKIAPDGTMTTVAGNGVRGYSGDGGLATNAALGGPRRLHLDAAGNLYISEFWNYIIRKVTPAGIISTVAGNGTRGFAGDGGLASKSILNHTGGIVTDASGRLYIADEDNHRIRVISTVLPTLSAAPGTLSFTAKSGGSTSAEQTISAISSINGVPFTVTPATTSGGAWLSAGIADSVAPTSVSISANPTGLPPGTYRGSVQVTSPAAIPGTISIPVTFTVTAGEDAKLGVDTKKLAFSFVQQASESDAASIAVRNLGGGTLDVSAQAQTVNGGNWLGTSRATGSATANAPATFAITAVAGSLAAGTYSGSVSVSSPTSGERVTIPVTMTITPPQSRILLSQTGITFTAVAKGGLPLPQSVGILNVGKGILNWQAKAVTLSGGSAWLKISAVSGTVNQPLLDVSFLDVSVDASSLAAGDYYGKIDITAPGADNSPQSISVVLNVLPAGTNPGPEVRPTGLVFTGIAGAPNPGSQDIKIANRTGAPVLYGSSRTFVGGGNWFLHVPTDATISPSSPGTIVVQPDFTKLTPDIRRAALSLAFSDGSTSTVSVLMVAAPAEATLKSATPRTVDGCTPTQLFPQLTSLRSGFTAPASQPLTIQARVVDNCGSSITNATGTVVARFSNRDSDLYLNHIRDGMWSGSWQPREVSVSQVQIVLDAYSGSGVQRVAGRTNPLSGTLTRGANIPLVAPGGVVNGASFVTQAPVAPGSLVAVFGSQLADANKDTDVMLGGKPLALFYVSDTQLNAQVPYDMPINSQQQLLVRRGGALSQPEVLTMAPAQPAIYTKDQSGKGQAVIVNGLSYVLAEPGTPVSIGDTVVIYCNGLGAVDPPVALGAAATGLSRTTNPLTVTIGGLVARVDFAGLAPGFAGVYQVNAVVPAGITAGNQVPVVLSIAGQVSPPVTIAVR